MDRDLQGQCHRVRLCLGLELRFGCSDAFEPALLVGHPVRRFVAPAVGPMPSVLGRIGGIGLVQPGRDLGGELRLLLHHVFVAHSLVLTRVGPQLGAVHCHMAQLDQAGHLAQAQHLDKKLLQRRRMALAEVADGAEVRTVQPGDRHDIHSLLAGPGQLAAGVDAAAVAIQEQGHQHIAMIGRLALLGLVDAHDRRQVQRFTHRVPHEMCQVTWRNKLMHRRRQKPRLINVPCSKGLALV
jgi:hypothetical protein